MSENLTADCFAKTMCIAHDVIFFPRVILYNFFLFLLIYGGFGVVFWVFGVGAFS